MEFHVAETQEAALAAHQLALCSGADIVVYTDSSLTERGVGEAMVFTFRAPESSHWPPSYSHCIRSGILRHIDGAHPNTQQIWTGIPTFPSSLYGNHLYRQPSGDTSVLSPRKVFWPIYPERDHTHCISATGTTAGIYSCIGSLVMKAFTAMSVLMLLQKKPLILQHPTVQRS